MKALTGEWFAHHRGRMACWHHDRPHDALEDIRRMEAEILELLEQRKTTPATATITAYRQDGTMSDTYKLGDPIYLSVDVRNAEGDALTGVEGNWTVSSGTLSVNPNNPQEATVVSATAGEFDANWTSADGTITAPQYTAAVVDGTPASASISGSATAPADETTAASA